MTDQIQQSSKTLAVRIEEEILWDYEEYRYFGGRLQTEEVSSPEARDVIWSVEIEPIAAGRDEGYHHDMVFDYQCTVTCQMERSLMMVQADVSIYLIDGERREVTTCRDWNFIKPSDGGEATWSEKINNVFDVGGDATLVAEISFSPPVSIAEERQWASKFSQLYGDQASSDCIIQIGNSTIPAHRCILMAHSPVFRVIFTSPIAEESKSAVVEISDFLPESVRAMIRYCYEGHTDPATLEEDRAKEVFQLADKYDIDQLKANIERHFEKKLTVENVLKMALLADSHSAPKLRKACVKLLTRERTICASAGWEELKRIRPELAEDLAKEASVKTGGIGMKRSLVL